MNMRFFQITLILFVFWISSCDSRIVKEQKAGAASEVSLSDGWDNENNSPYGEPSIWDITKRHGSFSTFSHLVEIAELEETLKSNHAITLLAPTDEAFNQLSQETIRHLLKKENLPVLKELLLNHVIQDMYLSMDLLDGETASTLSGNNLIISRGNEIKVGNAKVTTADINARNGVVHVVDQVIIPQ